MSKLLEVDVRNFDLSVPLSSTVEKTSPGVVSNGS
jgi:hypothetical protein